MDDRLDSWKEIAAYVGREVRTVQRWARARSLPVHRVPGGSRPRVYSSRAEIDFWMRTGSPHAREEQPSVAVLPFQNLGGARREQYFGDGLAEDVINALVRIPGLRVTARTSSSAFAAPGQDVRKVGAALGAAWLIEGSVRRDGGRVRVSAQLVNSTTGYHAWSQRYDAHLSDIFAIQDEIARAIAQALKLTLALESPRDRPTGDLGAYDLWLQGRSISQRFTPVALAKARACYEAAIARDPRFARPYFGLAELLFYGVQFGLAASPDESRRVRAAITTSLDLDDSFGEAHALAGVIRGILDYDWPGAEAAFHRALELSPGSATILIEHAWYHLVPRMLVADALAQAERAVALDPLSPLVRGFFGLVLIAARQFARATVECREALSLAPRLWWLRWFYATALVLHGRTASGMKEFRKVYTEIHDPLQIGLMAGLCAMFHRSKEAEALMSELETSARTAYVPPFAMAFAYLGFGDDRVFEWLVKAIDMRDPLATHLPSMPLYDGIRDDPRFHALLARMHLDRTSG